jgi:hypothetical protein
MANVVLSNALYFIDVPIKYTFYLFIYYKFFKIWMDQITLAPFDPTPIESKHYRPQIKLVLAPASR